MKQLLLYSLFITTNLACMITTDVVPATKDKVYRYWYTKCIAQILPLELCKQIDCISAQLRNKKIRESLIKTTPDVSKEIDPRFGELKLILSNNGHYYAHNIPPSMWDHEVVLCDTEKNNILRIIETGFIEPLYFSPNNEYCVIKNDIETYVVQIRPTATSSYPLHSLVKREEHMCHGITISNDSKHILFETRHNIRQSTPIYKLWTLDAQGIPRTVPLKNDLRESWGVIFHPDNKHIIHNNYRDELRLHNLETSEDKIIFSEHNKNIYGIDKLTLSPDNKRIIATYIRGEFLNNHGHILFNIEDLDNVTSIAIPDQSLDSHIKLSELPPLCIPHKNMITHITNNGHTLQLLDTKMQNIATHLTKEEVYITALAVDNSGNYLAAGYSDGTIMIWHLFSANPAEFEKIFMKSNGKITLLTFSDNRLLLSQSESAFCIIKGKRVDSTTATLWDMYGNEIINFGNRIVKSIISPNGKSIITLSLTQKAPDSIFCDSLTLTTYHQTDEDLAQCSQNNELKNFSYLRALENQMPLDAQQQVVLLCNQ